MHLGCCFQMHGLKPVKESRQAQLNYFSSEIKNILQISAQYFGIGVEINRLLPSKSAYWGCGVYVTLYAFYFRHWRVAISHKKTNVCIHLRGQK